MSKRIFDIVVASIGLLLLSPLMAAVAIWIKLDSPGPVFRHKRRRGRGDIPFDLLGFRIETNRNEARLPRPLNALIKFIGRQLLECKAEKLPQLMNVLRGDMSLVGPRPELLDADSEYDRNERRILTLRPGMTDWASLWICDERGILAGAPDPTAAYERVIHRHKIELQIYYLDSHTIWSDLRIIVASLIRVIYPRWMPSELRNYPTFAELRAEVVRLIATEQIYRRAA